MTINTISSQETIKLGKRFAKVLASGDVVVLEGELGGGKTTFVRGIVSGLCLRSRAKSPSFTLMRHYAGRAITLHHIDLYRLNQRSIFDLGIEDYLYAPGAVTIIEWGEKIETILPRFIRVSFAYTAETGRRIIFTGKGYKKSKLALLSRKQRA
ncbi:MAG: tRNA (adenosine(37)-N6)-threonylcarbamoyltransferase complex ATPase subunit type 1 TsaE [Candidatus Omnitrophota bacterium]